MRKIKLSAVFNTVVIIICICLIAYFVFSKDGLRDFVRNSKGVVFTWLIGALACHLGNVAVDCILTKQFAKQKYPKFTIMDGIKTAVTGHFFSSVTPGGSGGQPMQIYCLNKLGIDIGFASSMLMQKFIIYQITATIYAFVLFVFKSKFVLSNIHGKFTIWFVVIGFATQVFSTLFVLLAGFNPKFLKRAFRLISPILRKLKGQKESDRIVRSIDAKINVFRKSNRKFMKKPRLILLYMVEVALQITMIYSVPYFIYKSLIPNGSGEWTTMLCAVAFVNIVSAMIPIPGASGVSELAFSVFFGAFFTSSTLKSAILIWRMITYYFTIAFEGPLSTMGTNKEKLSPNDVIEVISQEGNSENKGDI